MLFSYSLPKSLCGGTIMTAANLVNRCPFNAIEFTFNAIEFKELKE